MQRRTTRDISCQCDILYLFVTQTPGTDLPTLERAIAIAADAHAGQFDKAGAPYILHPIRVMQGCISPDAQIAAILHDVVEDCGITLLYLKRQGFSKKALNAIEAVTKRPDEEVTDDGYFRFVRRAMLDPVGREVKRADLIDNLDVTRIKHVTDADRKRLERYTQAIAILDCSA